MSLGKHIERISVGFAGGLIALIGIILIPLPGAGILIVFAGLGILSKEFDFAKRWNVWLRKKYDAMNERIKRRFRSVKSAVMGWTARRSDAIKSLLSLAAAVLVVVLAWLINCFGYINQFLGLNWNWLETPIEHFR